MSIKPRVILGIDFGTTKTIVAEKKLGAAAQDPHILEINGHEVTPTALLLTPEGEVEAFGREAFNAFSDPNLRSRTFLNFKRLMGRRDAAPFELRGSKSLRAEDLALLFLIEVRKALERGRNGAPIDPETITVIGYPASWSEMRKKTILAAAEQAGFPNVDGCEEPIAALHYHHYRSELDFDKEQRVLVFDAGGGTTDLCMALLRRGGSAPEVLATCGCGVAGTDIDDALTVNFAERAGATSADDVATIRSATQVFKEELPNTWGREQATVIKKFRVFLSGLLRHFSAEITRDDFESICRPKLNDMLAEIPRLLNKSGHLRPEQVPLVVLAGGMGRLFCVQEGVRKRFRSSEVLVSPTPQKVIALGLVLAGLRNIEPACYLRAQRAEVEQTSQIKEVCDHPKQQKKRAVPESKEKKVAKWILLAGLILLGAALFYFINDIENLLLNL